MARRQPLEGKLLQVRLDEETATRLEERAVRDERDIAQQARFYIRRGLDDAEHDERQPERAP
jgi:hypothetical protein